MFLPQRTPLGPSDGLASPATGRCLRLPAAASLVVKRTPNGERLKKDCIWLPAACTFVEKRMLKKNSALKGLSGQYFCLSSKKTLDEKRIKISFLIPNYNFT